MRTIIATLVVFLFFLESHAQFEIGPRVGLQTFKTVLGYKGDRDIYKSKFRVGFKFGGLIKVDLKPSFDVMADLSYSRKGRSIEIRESKLQNKSRYNFIESSMMLRYKFPKSQYQGINYQLFVGLGPNFSYWINGKGSFGGKIGPKKNYRVVFSDTPVDLGTMNLVNANRYQWGIDVGVGAIIEVYKAQKVIVDLRFTKGHTYLGDENSSAYIPILDFSDNLEANFRVISISAAYMFEIDFRQLKKGGSTIKRRKMR